MNQTCFSYLIIWTVLNWLLCPIYGYCHSWKIAMFNTNIPTTNNPNSNENPYLREVFTPRPGIHYVVAPKSDYSSTNPEIKCSYGSTPTYIKSQEEWNDWKFILGIVV